MNIVKDYLDKNRFSRPMIPRIDTRGIVFHYTGGPGHSAKGIKKYFNGLKKQWDKFKKYGRKLSYRYASTPYVVGLKGEIVEMMPPDELAYHVGGGKVNRSLMKRLGIIPKNRNHHLIGIEMCINKSGNFTEETLNASVWLGVHLMKKYKLSKDRIFRHYDITRKRCPLPFCGSEEKDLTWRKFYQRIQEQL